MMGNMGKWADGWGWLPVAALLSLLIFFGVELFFRRFVYGEKAKRTNPKEGEPR